ncbi:MAG: YARHG domain-containing protein [Bacteroidota bacterium]
MKVLSILVLGLTLGSSLIGQSTFEKRINRGGTLTKQEMDDIFNGPLMFDGLHYYIERIEMNRPGIWALVKGQSGVCGREWIYNFSYDGSILANMVISESCDHDGMFRSSSMVRGRILYPEPIIEVVTTIWEVVDTTYLITDTNDMRFMEFKEGYSFHDSDVEHQTILQYEYYGITETNSFYNICEDSTEKDYRTYPFTYFKLLDEPDLAAYSLDELRIMRNEIFADYGYSFKSAYLRKYFSSKDWYFPTGQSNEEVIAKMNLIEKRNVQQIRKVEESKKR